MLGKEKGATNNIPQKRVLAMGLVQVQRPPEGPGINLLLSNCEEKGLPGEGLEGLSGASGQQLAQPV